MIYGYARVSTEAQDLTPQLLQLRGAGCDKVYSEKASGTRADRRKQLGQVIAALLPGDVLIVASIDRLARNSRDLFNIVDTILKRGGEFRSLREPWADTAAGPTGQFMRALFAAVAELDRAMIMERTGEGRTRARGRGVKMGRKPVLSPAQVKFINKHRDDDTMSADDLARVIGCSRSTVFRVRNKPKMRRPDLAPTPLEAAIREA